MLYNVFHLQESDKSRREIRRQRGTSRGQHRQLLVSPGELRDNQAWWVAGDKLHRLWPVLKPAILRTRISAELLMLKSEATARQSASARMLGALLSPLLTRSAIKADSVMSYSLSAFFVHLFVCFGNQFLGALECPVTELVVIVFINRWGFQSAWKTIVSLVIYIYCLYSFLLLWQPAQSRPLCDPGSHPGSWWCSLTG